MGLTRIFILSGIVSSLEKNIIFTLRGKEEVEHILYQHLIFKWKGIEQTIVIDLSFFFGWGGGADFEWCVRFLIWSYLGSKTFERYHWKEQNQLDFKKSN